MWKTLRKTCFFGCLLFTFVCVSLSFSKNANATSVPNANITRSYYHQSIGITNNESVGSQSIPYTAIGYQQGVIKRLYGIVASTVPNDPYTDKYKTISVNFTITQENFVDHNNNSLHDTPFHYLYVTAGGQEYQIDCSVNRWIDSSVSGNSYTCNAYFSNYERITAISIRAGIMNADQNTTPIGTVGCPPGSLICNLGQIKLESFTYTISASADPLIQGQQTIINQNQTIINNQNEIKDFLTDDTPPNVDSSSLSQSAGWLPAGPVDSILTLPISLLQGVVNVFTNPSACQDVILPLPFVNTNLTLPCVGPILSQIGITPLWNVVGAIIGFFLIWNTLKWLYKFVDDTLTMRENESSLWGGL